MLLDGSAESQHLIKAEHLIYLCFALWNNFISRNVKEAMRGTAIGNSILTNKDLVGDLKVTKNLGKRDDGDINDTAKAVAASTVAAAHSLMTSM